MDILVMGLVALVLFIIVLLIVFYISIRKRHNEKEILKIETLDVYDSVDEDEINMFTEHDSSNDFKFMEETGIVANADIKELVNVLIDKKNYIFIANDNKLSKGDSIKLLLDKKITYGVVTKGNYERDITSLKTKPNKLIIIKDNNNKQNVLNIEELVPKKKNK